MKYETNHIHGHGTMMKDAGQDQGSRQNLRNNDEGDEMDGKRQNQEFKEAFRSEKDGLNEWIKLKIFFPSLF